MILLIASVTPLKCSLEIIAIFLIVEYVKEKRKEMKPVILSDC